MELGHRIANVAGRHVLALTGDLDVATLPRFNDYLVKLLTGSTGKIGVVDIDGLGFMDDAALGLLLGAAGRARAVGGDLVVVVSEDRLRRRLAATGFDKAVRVVAAISEAR